MTQSHFKKLSSGLCSLEGNHNKTDTSTKTKQKEKNQEKSRKKNDTLELSWLVPVLISKENCIIRTNVFIK
jgi:hypothetical protein